MLSKTPSRAEITLQIVARWPRDGCPHALDWRAPFGQPDPT